MAKLDGLHYMVSLADVANPGFLPAIVLAKKISDTWGEEDTFALTDFQMGLTDNLGLDPDAASEYLNTSGTSKTVQAIGVFLTDADVSASLNGNESSLDTVAIFPRAAPVGGPVVVPDGHGVKFKTIEVQIDSV